MQVSGADIACFVAGPIIECIPCGGHLRTVLCGVDALLRLHPAYRRYSDEEIPSHCVGGP